MNVWPTAIQLHIKVYGSKEELEKTCRHIHLADWTLSVAAIKKKKKNQTHKKVENNAIYYGDTTCELSRYKTTLKQQLNGIPTHEKVQNNAIYLEETQHNFRGNPLYQGTKSDT